MNVPYSFFNFLFTMNLYAEKPLPKFCYEDFYKKLLGDFPDTQEYPLTDPIFPQDELPRYIACVEEGIQKGMLIIHTESHGYRYVFDDGKVLGQRVGPLSGNYWILLYERWLIVQGFLRIDGKPKRGEFHSILKNHFPIVPEKSVVKANEAKYGCVLKSVPESETIMKSYKNRT